MQYASDMAHSVCSVCYWITCKYENMDVKTNNANNYYYSGDWLRNMHWAKHNYTQPGIATENWIGNYSDAFSHGLHYFTSEIS